MRSARNVIALCAAVLVAVPLTMVVVAGAYEAWSMSAVAQELHRIARTMATSPTPEALGQEFGVLAIRLDAQGRVVNDSGSQERAIHRSTVGGLLDRLVDWGTSSEPPLSWEQVESGLPPLASRPEVVTALEGQPSFRTYSPPGGNALLYSHAQPLPDGGALVVERVSQRGMRRLVGLRKELMKLLLWQLLAAGVVVWVLARQLVLPLERLAHLVRRFPEAAPRDEQLLARQDEVGQLTKAVHQLASQLEQRRKATADLAADVAHELKNPLATIAASAELFGSTRDFTPEKRALLEKQILGAVERLRLNGDELLALARLEAALPQTPRRAVHYRALIEGLLSEYRADPRYAHVTFHLDVAADVGQVQLAEEPWRRLLRNLLDNALIQPTQTPRIEVRVDRQDREIRTRIRDFGPGVSEGNREKIFRRFFTQRPPEVPAGTGLGLSIVQTVAAAHGGRVELEQVSPGACFSVLAPLELQLR